MGVQGRREEVERSKGAEKSTCDPFDGFTLGPPNKEFGELAGGAGGLKDMLEGLTPLEIGPQEGSCGSSIKGEQHGDDEGEEYDGFAHLHSPSIKPSRDASLFNNPAKALSPGKSKMSKAHSFADMSSLNLEDRHREQQDDGAATSPSDYHKVLEHTIGTVKEDGGAHVKATEAKGVLKKSSSTLDIHKIVDADEEEILCALKPIGFAGEKLLVVLDMDHTMVGCTALAHPSWASGWHCSTTPAGHMPETTTTRVCAKSLLWRGAARLF